MVNELLGCVSRVLGRFEVMTDTCGCGAGATVCPVQEFRRSLMLSLECCHGVEK